MSNDRLDAITHAARTPARVRLLRRGFALATAAGLLLALGAGVFLAIGQADAERGGPERSATPTAAATATNTPTPSLPPLPTSSTSTPVPTQPPPSPARESRTLPFGPIPADRAVVHTGDGDCLNVRPVPSKQFESDPRFCLNEGEIVYLHGDPVDADGEAWRYALGRGWLATRYVYLEPRTVEQPLGGFESVFLRGDSGLFDSKSGTVRMFADGRLQEIPRFVAPSGQPGEGVTFSPDGRWAAYTLGAPSPIMHIMDLETGQDRAIPAASAMTWSADSKLLVSSGGCDPSCARKAAWMYPTDAAPTPLALDGEDYASVMWMRDGESVLAVVNGQTLLSLGLDGSSEVLLDALPEGIWLGQASISEDGRSLLVGGITGPLRMVDLATGRVTEFERAAQPITPRGSCGGSIGKLSDWLSSGRIVYHESFAAKGSNGITIGDVETGRRDVLSFWNIGDLETVGDDRVTFTSYEQMNDLSFQLTWLLDTTTGEARPIAVGTEAGWVR